MQGWSSSMVSRIANPETSRSGGSGALAAHAPAPVRTKCEKPEKKILKFCKNEAKRSRNVF
jgi:hypothetical protein